MKHLGLVQGSTVRAKHVGKDLFASLKNIVGGELKAYTELLQESRDEALERMVKQAQAIGANAVLNVRFATSSITQGAAELFAYGTAVVLERSRSMEALFDYFELLLGLVLAVTGFVVGRLNERRHYASIRQRERRLPTSWCSPPAFRRRASWPRR